jgi:hypothetical protein
MRTVVDALGRTSPAPAWLAEIGASPPPLETSDCKVLYYTRYYRVRHGETLPEGPWIPTPRGILPYCLFSSFPGDNRTFGALLAILPQDRERKFSAAWMRSRRRSQRCRRCIPGPHAPTRSPMSCPWAASRTAFVATGPAGDVECLGSSPWATRSATPIPSTALADASRLEDVPEAYHPAVEPEAVERFALATECDQSRGRWWRGEPVDFVHRSGARSSSSSPPAVPRLSATPTSSAPTSVDSGSSTARPFWTTTPPSSSAWRVGPPTREELLARIPPAP